MTPDEIQTLLDQLARGEPGAAGDLSEAYSAYLRSLVRRRMSSRLRTQFDSADVVQSVWVQVVRQISGAGWRLDSERQLLALLSVVAQRRLYARARSPVAAAASRTSAGDFLDGVAGTGQPRASEVAQAGELWDRLSAHCPPEHLDVLRLRRDGYQLTEIAERTGLHEGSVRRILRRLSRDLALGVGGDARRDES